MKTYVNFLMVIMLVFTVFACYPGGAEYVDELDTSITKFDPDYNFNQLEGKYYHLPKQITHIKDGKKEDDPDRTFDAKIMAQVKKHLEEDEGLLPAEGVVDTTLAVGITIIKQNNMGVGWIPGGGWWGGWYPGYPGWGWGGYYPWYPVYYNFKTGSVVIEMASYEKKENKLPPLVYSGVLDGLMQGSDKYTEDRIYRGIEEVFNHQPFEHPITKK